MLSELYVIFEGRADDIVICWGSLAPKNSTYILNKKNTLKSSCFLAWACVWASERSSSTQSMNKEMSDLGCNKVMWLIGKMAEHRLSQDLGWNNEESKYGGCMNIERRHGVPTDPVFSPSKT